MPLMHNYLFDQLLIPALFAFFLVSGLFGFGFGIGLIVYRARAFQLFDPLNRWFSARRNLEVMEATHTIEPFVYRNRRWFSTVFIAGGLFSIFMLVAKTHAATVATLFYGGRAMAFETWIVQSLGVLLVVGSVLAVVIGVVLGFFPQKLREFERRTNHWFSSRQMVKGADDMHLPLDRWFHTSPRAAGCILAIAALILTINSTIVLFGRG